MRDQARGYAAGAPLPDRMGSDWTHQGIITVERAMFHVGSHFGCAGQSPPCAWAAATQYVPAIAVYTTVSAISVRERTRLVPRGAPVRTLYP